jgi:hypothetical protein
MVQPMVTGALDPAEWTVVLRWKSGCQVAFPEQCPDVFDLGSVKPDLLILSDYAYTDENTSLSKMQAAYPRGAATIAQQAAHTIIFGQPAAAPASLVDCVGRDLEIGAQCRGDISSDDYINPVKKNAAAAIGASYVDLTTWTCTAAGTCPAVIGSTPTLVDKIHLQYGIAVSLAPLLRLKLLNDGIVTPPSA